MEFSFLRVRQLQAAFNRNATKILKATMAPLHLRFPRQMNRLASIMAASKASGVQGVFVKKQSAIASLMDNSDDPLKLADAIISTSTSHHPFLEVNAWFQNRWAKRDQRAYDLVRGVGGDISGPTHVWLRLMACEILAIPVPVHAAEQLLEQIEALDFLVRKICEDAVMRILIRNGHGQLFLDLLRNSPIRQRRPLSSNMKVEVARLLLSSDGGLAGEEAAEFLGELSAFERAKIVASGVPIDGMKSTHAELEKCFVDLTRPSVAKTFSQLVIPAYDKLRPQMRFIDSRTDLAQRAELTRLIHEALVGRRPFSLVRLGDGEAYLFGDGTSIFTDADRRMRERHWWNMQLADEDRDALKSRSLSAVIAADVVGVPSIHRFFRDFSENTGELFTGVASRGIVTSILGAAAILPATTMVTEDRVHHLIFGESSLRDLVRGADRVVIVSSVHQDVISESFGTLRTSVVAVTIPTHAKTKGNPKFVEWDEPLPMVTERIEQQLLDLVRPGDLVLVSAGVAGKSFVGVAKQRGAVGLDVGGQIEPLVGIPNGPIF